MNQIIEISSKGLYSSWCYHKPSRTLFDCGEGFATYQGNFIYGIERVMISHGHGDHILGLPSLIGCRNSARGDREKALEIYYPYGDKLVESVRDFINNRNSHLRFEVKWVPIMPGFEIELSKTQYIQAFDMEHQKNKNTLGYRILEKRSKLRPEFVGKNIPDILKTGVNKDDIKVDYTANTFVYALDAFFINRVWLDYADIAVMDCTFLKDADRDEMTHYTLHEAVNTCRAAGVKKVIAAHFSPRYLYPQIKQHVDDLNKTLNKLDYIIPVYHNQVTKI